MIGNANFSVKKTDISNDATIYNIGDIDVSVTNKGTIATIDVTLNNLIVHEIDNYIVTVLNLSDDSGNICGLLVGFNHSKINNLIRTLKVNNKYHISGFVLLNKDIFNEFEVKYNLEEILLIKDMFGDKSLAIRTIRQLLK